MKRILAWLRRTLSPARELVHLCYELRRRVEQLEQMQLRRELEWEETRDQVLRHLRRLNAVKQHLDERTEKEQQRQEDDEPNGARPSPAAVLAAKFRR